MSHNPVERTTLSGRLPEQLQGNAPAPLDPQTGMYKDYWILSDVERAQGFIRPVRYEYKHKACGAITHMHRKIAETYAHDPQFYSGTFCANCGKHYPLDQFVWKGTDIQLGT